LLCLLNFNRNKIACCEFIFQVSKVSISVYPVLLFFASCISTRERNLPVTSDALDEVRTGFSVPPDSTKPYVYWYWVSDNISKEGITRDLEAMAKVGIGEAFIGNIGVETVAYGNVKVLSEEWWELTRFAITEGQRVGVDIGIFNSPGWSQSGGPWVKPGEAMRYMVSSEVLLTGGQRVTVKLPKAKDTMQDVAVIAFPLPQEADKRVSDFKPAVRLSPAIGNGNRFI
jgi:hypothetical protein